MNYKYLLYEKKGRIAIITMNNERVLNALNTATLHELNDVFEKIDVDDEIAVVLITGAGKAFVAGADIKEMSNMSVDESASFAKTGMAVFMKIERLSKPVIAAVNGFTLGGGLELASACDIRIASTKAIFGQPEVGLGITPGFGGTQRLARIVGIPMAKQMIFTASNVKADRAFEIGLVNELVEPEELMNRAMELAEKISSNGSAAVSYSKEAINFGLQADIQTAMEIEKNIFAKCFATDDQKEGMKAFIEKRKPNFKK